MPTVLNDNQISELALKGSTPFAQSDAPSADELTDQQRILRRTIENEGEFLLGVLRSRVKKQNVASGREIGEVALDFFTELYIEAMKSAHKFNAELSPLPYLLGIAHNLILRKGHERGQNAKRAVREFFPADLPHQNEDGDAAQDAEIFDRVAAAHSEYSLNSATTPLEKFDAAREILNLVSGDDAQILELSIIHGLDGETLAGVLGVQPAAARKRFSRALQRLREAYSQHILNPSAPESGAVAR